MHAACLLKTDLDRSQIIDVLDVFLGKAREIEIRFSMCRKMENHVLPTQRLLLSYLYFSAMVTTGVMMGVV